MKLTVMKPVEVEASYVHVLAPVRYGEEDIPNDFPGRSGKLWSVVINLHNGDLYLADRTRFPSTVTCNMCMKVVDGGTYRLLDDTFVEIAEIDGDYVPRFFPERGGDYLEFVIRNGRLENWNAKPADVAAAFFRDED